MKRALSVLSLTSVAAAVLYLRAARGDVPPASERIYYSGTLVENGQPVEGTHTIELRLYDAAVNGNQLCSPPQQQIDVVHGAFRMNVSACADELQAATDAFVQLIVDGESLPPAGTGRPRVGAVPYAVQAISADLLTSGLPADQVTTGETTVEARLDALEARIVPPGTTVAYAGATPPPGWLICDGSAVSRALYPDLLAAIGAAWGAGDGTTTFNLPDLRGRFLRGVDAGALRDPEAGTRAAPNPGGNTGDAVGSVQEDMFASHVHGRRSGAGTGQWPALTQGYQVDFPNTTSPTGGSETRPKNANVNFIIKY